MRNSQVLECGTLVAGGGLYGCGFAAAIPDAVLVEENNVPGADFLLSLEQYRREHFSAGPHPLAAQFQASLLARNAYTREGLLHPGALAPELYAWLLQTEVKVCLNSALFLSGEGALLLAGGEGIREVRCRRFHDLRKRQTDGGKIFRALIDFRGTGVICGTFPGFTLCASAIPGYAVLSIELEPSDTWTDARRKLRMLWNSREPELAAGKIAWSAAAFSHNSQEGPIHALNAGLLDGEAAQ